MSVINEGPVLAYLSLPRDYNPSPSGDPIAFLKLHLRQLPPHLLAQFSVITTPKQRTVISAIRNRRTKYASSNPKELSYEVARRKWPKFAQSLGQINEKDNPLRAIPAEASKDEREWAEHEFLGGQKQQVGKLGALLGGYAEEREAERLRTERREQGASEELEFIPEEDSDSDEDVDMDASPEQEEEANPVEERAYFERLVRERYVYGLLEDADYEAVDWNDYWDEQIDRDEEERWFDEEEPEEGE